MKNFRFLFYIFLIVLFNAYISFAQDDLSSKIGTTSGNILLMEIGPRAIGMGGAYVGVADDASTLFWNPAGTSLIKKPTLQYQFGQRYADVQHHFAGLTFPLTDDDGIGLMVQYLSVGEMDVTTIENPEGTGETFDANNTVITLNYSRQLTDRVHVGVSAKYIYERIWMETAQNFAFDIGTIYNIDELGLRIGMNILNLGTDMGITDGPHLLFFKRKPDDYPGSPSPKAELAMDKYPLPTSFSLGVSAVVIGRKTTWIKNAEHKLLLTGSIIDSFDDPFRINIGAEYGWNDIFYLRTGYRFFYDSQSFSAGFGLNFNQIIDNNVSIDYVWVDYGDLGGINVLGLEFRF